MNQRYYTHPGGPYRSRNGMIFGVCRGLADYFDFSAFWLRFICIVAFIFTGFFPVVVAYIVAALLMKLEPAIAFETDGDQEFYNSYAASRPMALGRLKTTFDSLDRRIQRMESIVTDRAYDWDERLRSS